MNGIENGSAEFPSEALTRREREVLALLEEGLTSREIAERLTLAVSTARWYIRQVYGKLGVNSKRQATESSRALGLLKPTPRLPETLSPPPPSPGPKHNLPLQLTSFIGRDKEIAVIVELLGKHRLVTLTGSGGTGKTRLALHATGQMLENYPRGVWLVQLAPLTDPAPVLSIN